MSSFGYTTEVTKHGFRLREIPVAVEESLSVRGKEIATAEDLLKKGYTSEQLLSVLAGRSLDEKSQHGGSRLIPYGTVIDDTEVNLAEHQLRYVEDANACKKGNIMLLRPLTLNLPNPTMISDAVVPTCQVTFATDELVPLRYIPKSLMAQLTEGEHFLRDWDEEARRARAKNSEPDEIFSMEPSLSDEELEELSHGTTRKFRH